MYENCHLGRFGKCRLSPRPMAQGEYQTRYLSGEKSRLSPSALYTYTVSAYDTAGNGSGQPYAVSAITQESDSVCTDNDGDGWCVQDGDCDDYNDKVYPGHKDTKGRWG